MFEENVKNNGENFEGEDFFEMTMGMLKSNPTFDELVETHNEELEVIREIEAELEEIRKVIDWDDEESVSELREYERQLLELKRANGLAD